MLSIVLPVYNEKESLPLMVRILNATLEFEHVIIIVYDDLNDNCIPEAKKLEKKLSNIKLIHNNFGKGVKYAISAGIKNSKFENILITSVDEIFPILAFFFFLLHGLVLIVDRKSYFLKIKITQLILKHFFLTLNIIHLKKELLQMLINIHQ